MSQQPKKRYFRTTSTFYRKRCCPRKEPRPPGEPRFQIRATGATARSYNYVAARGPQKTTNVIESIGHLVKSCLGGGVVAIHEAYKNCGLLTATGLNVFLGIFVAYCMHVLVKSAQVMYGRLQTPKMSYPDLAEATLATGPFPRLRKYDKWFRYCVDITIGIDLFGSCCVYCVIIARSIRELITYSEVVTEEENLPLRAYIAVLTLPILLICMITTLKYLAPFSIVADIFIGIVAGATIYYGVKHKTKSPLDFPLLKDIGGLLQFMGVCVFSMEGVGVSLPIENHMKDPSKFDLVLFGGMSIVTGVVMIVGFFGYWGFGEAAKSPVTLNFPWSPFSIFLKGFMAVMIYVTFALNFWVPFELMWFYLKKRHPEDRLWLWERVYRAVIVIIIVVIAVIFPNISSFMGLLGSFCLSSMGFMFPAVIQLVVEYEDPGLGLLKWRMFRFLFIFFFGLGLCILGTFLNGRQLLKDTGMI